MSSILIPLLAAVISLSAVFRPWMGVVGYTFFVVLCPQWYWRWTLPALDYQKYIAAATLVGILTNGVRLQKLSRLSMVAVLSLLTYLLCCYLSAGSSISPLKSQLYLDTSWKIVLMACVFAFFCNSPRAILWTVVGMFIAQGWNAYQVNDIYFSRGYILVRYFEWNFLDSNTYSNSTIPIMAIAVGFLFCAKTRSVKFLSGAVFLLQAHQIMLLESRGAMIGVIATFALALFWMPKNRYTRSVAGIALLASSILAGPPVVKEFASAFDSAEDRDTSADSRIYLWKAGTKIMADYPLLGVGPWAGEVIVPDYYEGELDAHRKALHNLFFEVGTGCGIPGVTAFLAFFWLTWFQHLRVRRKLHNAPDWFQACNLAIVAGIPGYWIASMFSSGALIESPYFFVSLGISSLAIFGRQLEQTEEEEEESNDYEDNEGAATYGHSAETTRLPSNHSLINHDD